jgi:hypothetical protein
MNLLNATTSANHGLSPVGSLVTFGILGIIMGFLTLGNRNKLRSRANDSDVNNPLDTSFTTNFKRKSTATSNTTFLFYLAIFSFVLGTVLLLAAGIVELTR